jgi:hypothetical protein
VAPVLITTTSFAARMACASTSTPTLAFGTKVWTALFNENQKMTNHITYNTLGGHQIETSLDDRLVKLHAEKSNILV